MDISFLLLLLLDFNWNCRHKYTPVYIPQSCAYRETKKKAIKRLLIIIIIIIIFLPFLFHFTHSMFRVWAFKTASQRSKKKNIFMSIKNRYTKNSEKKIHEIQIKITWHFVLFLSSYKNWAFKLFFDIIVIFIVYWTLLFEEFS